MKQLKLDHELAELVAKGEKWSTLRMFDDKDLSVNDEVELVDKVDPDNRETWTIAGKGIVYKVIEKRLGELTNRELEGHVAYRDKHHILETFRKYYGNEVSLTTPVKVVYFDFIPLSEEMRVVEASKKGEAPPALNVSKVKIFADGGSRGNPGPSASGFVILDENDKVLVDEGIYLGVTTNNQAEYQAVKFALEEARRIGVKEADLYLDSLLVVNQMKGTFKVRNRDLWPIHDAIKKLAATFHRVSFTHVPREHNKLADAAVNRALDEELGLSPRLNDEK